MVPINGIGLFNLFLGLSKFAVHIPFLNSKYFRFVFLFFNVCKPVMKPKGKRDLTLVHIHILYLTCSMHC